MNSQIMLRSAAGAWMCIAVMGGGCNREAIQPLTSDAFVNRRVEGRVDPRPIDNPGQVVVDGVKPPTDAPPEPADPARNDRVTAISPTVRNAAREPGETPVAATRPTRKTEQPAPTQQTTTAVPENDPSGQYVIYGTVLCVVNNRPIYAHKVLAAIDKELRAEAKNYDERGFRTIATQRITDRIRAEQRAELVFAVAEKSLGEQEKLFAEGLTAQWKNEQVTKAGGSEELAKRRWADEGWDFDELLEQKYRSSMTMVFFQRRVFPLVSVSPTQMREYYERNKDTKFAKQAQAKFRVIKIDPKQLKISPEEAKALAQSIRAKAETANFEELARETNEPILKASGGLVPGNDNGWLPKGTYVAEKVEDAVWQLRAGAVTNVIEERGAYFVAKLEDRKDATTEPFESLEVQSAIDETLRSAQYAELQDKFQNKLIKEAAVQENPQMVQVAVDMAMQRYRAWTSSARK